MNVHPSIQCNPFYDLEHPAKPAETTEAATGPHPPGHNSLLTVAMLNNQTMEALKAKEAQGNEDERRLIGLAKQAIGNGQVQLSANQPSNGIALFEMRHNQDVLVIKTKVDEHSKYEILSVGFTGKYETSLSMTPRAPSSFKLGASRHRTTLRNLPNELLHEIVGSTTGKRDNGINLNLRLVSALIKGIADNHLGPDQRYLVTNHETLRAAGYDSSSISDLLKMAAEKKQFVLDNGPKLKCTADYDGSSVNDLAKTSARMQRIALDEGPKLKQYYGYNGAAINRFSKLRSDQRDFVLKNGRALHEGANFDGQSINRVAKYDDRRKSFILNNAKKLYEDALFASNHIEELSLFGHEVLDFALTYSKRLFDDAGYDSQAILHLAQYSLEQKASALEYGPTLRSSAGYDGSSINSFVRLTDVEKMRVWDNASLLYQFAGYDGQAINTFAKFLEPKQREFILVHGEWLHKHAGYDGAAINELSSYDSDRRAISLENGPTLYKFGYDGASINQFTGLTDEGREFVLSMGPALAQKPNFDAPYLNTLARLSTRNREFVIQNDEALRAIGYHYREIFTAANYSKIQQRFILDEGRKLYENGYKASEINAKARSLKAS
jgi:hypothetical protein